VANTIGKDKRSTSSARTTATSRLKTSGMGAAKTAAPDAPTPVDRDVAVAEADEEVEALDVVPSNGDDTEVSEMDEASDLAVARPGAGSLTRRAPAAPARGGFIGFVVHLLLLIPGARYVAASAQELRKVTAPTPREAWNMTLVVIAMSAVLAILLGAADLALIQGLQWVVGLGLAK
jgi:preprotein translocase SecE subunit